MAPKSARAGRGREREGERRRGGCKSEWSGGGISNEGVRAQNGDGVRGGREGRGAAAPSAVGCAASTAALLLLNTI